MKTNQFTKEQIVAINGGDTVKAQFMIIHYLNQNAISRVLNDHFDGYIGEDLSIEDFVYGQKFTAR